MRRSVLAGSPRWCVLVVLREDGVLPFLRLFQSSSVNAEVVPARLREEEEPVFILGASLYKPSSVPRPERATARATS